MAARERSRSPQGNGGMAGGFDEQTLVIIQALVDKRQFCRRSRDFDEADRIRDQLKAMQVSVTDAELAWRGPGGLSGAVDNGGLPPPGVKGDGKQGGKGGVRERRVGDWDCPGCGKVVWASKDECFGCGTDRYGHGGHGGGGQGGQGSAGYRQEASAPVVDPKVLEKQMKAYVQHALSVVKEIQTTEQFDEMASQVKDEMGRLPSGFLAGLVAAAARVTTFNPENIVELLPTLATKLKLQANGIATDAFALEGMVDILTAMAQLGSHEFLIFDTVATILMDEMDAIDSASCRRLMEAFNATSDPRHSTFVKRLQQQQEQQDEKIKKLQEQRDNMKRVLDARMQALQMKAANPFMQEQQTQQVSMPVLSKQQAWTPSRSFIPRQEQEARQAHDQQAAVMGHTEHTGMDVNAAWDNSAWAPTQSTANHAEAALEKIKKLMEQRDKLKLGLGPVPVGRIQP